MLKNFFTKNIGMKLLSIIIAIFMWVYVAIILNPQTEISVRDIHVAFSNYQELSNNNLLVLDEQTQTVNVKLRGGRDILSKIDKRSITASIDLSSCIAEGKYSLPIQINLPISGVTIIEQSLSEMSVNIDVNETKTLPVTLNLVGTCKDGFALSATKASTITPAKIILQGPKSELSKIETVQADINIHNKSEDFAATLNFSDLSFWSANAVEANLSKLSSSNATIEIKVYIDKIETPPIASPNSIEM